MRPAKIGPDLRLQQHGEATRRSHKSLRGYWRIFVKICLHNRILSLQQVEKNQIRLKLYDLLRRQNSVAATNIFTKFLQCKRSVLSLQRVSVTCCCNLSPSVYRTYPGFYLAMSFTVYRSAAQLCSITEIAPKSPVLCVNRNPIQYGFPAGAKAMRYSMNTYPIC